MSAAFWGTMAVFGVIAILAFGFLLLVTRYKRCASDEILVVYGRVGGGRASKCIHGGATMVWPLIQDFKKISLTPMTISYLFQVLSHNKTFVLMSHRLSLLV